MTYIEWWFNDDEMTYYWWDIPTIDAFSMYQRHDTKDVSTLLLRSFTIIDDHVMPYRLITGDLELVFILVNVEILTSTAI
jgi:hypothetical protein